VTTIFFFFFYKQSWGKGRNSDNLAALSQFQDSFALLSKAEPFVYCLDVLDGLDPSLFADISTAGLVGRQTKRPLERLV
jgi:hypothetical protein